MTSLDNLTQYDEDLEPNSMDIRTEYVEPITSSTYKYTFRLDQSGYLDTNSMLVFKLQAQNNTNTLRVNNWNGCIGGISRVIFQVGDNIINDVQDLYKYASLSKMNMPPSMRNKYLGHYLGNQFWTYVRKSDTEEFKQHNVQQKLVDGSPVGSISFDSDRGGSMVGKEDGSGGAVINSHRISTDKSTNPQYGIPLGMLIPALAGQKIPLFLFDKQRILITVEFNDSSKYCISSLDAKNKWDDSSGYGNAGVQDVIPVDVNLVIDYIIMPSDNQNEIMKQTQQQGGYNLSFYDVVNIEKNIPPGTNGTEQSVEHRIGQNNRELHNIYMWKESTNKNDFRSATSGGDPTAKSTQGFSLLGHQILRGFSTEEYNVNIDGRDEFDHFIFSPIAQYNELKASLGSDLRVDRVMYACDDNTCSSELSTNRSGLQGVFKPLSLSLRNGQPGVIGAGRLIGQYPVIWKWKRQCSTACVNNIIANDQAVKVNYFCEVSKTANILNTGNGMNVMVSY